MAALDAADATAAARAGAEALEFLRSHGDTHVHLEVAELHMMEAETQQEFDDLAARNVEEIRGIAAAVDALPENPNQAAVALREAVVDGAGALAPISARRPNPQSRNPSPRT